MPGGIAGRERWLAYAHVIAAAAVLTGCTSPEVGSGPARHAGSAGVLRGDLGGGCSVGVENVGRAPPLSARDSRATMGAAIASNESGRQLLAWVEDEPHLHWRVGAGAQAICSADDSEPSVKPFVQALGDRFVVVWGEGSLEEGFDLRALALDAEGRPLGKPVTVARNVIRQPLKSEAAPAAIRLWFLAAETDGFYEVVTTVQCGA